MRPLMVFFQALESKTKGESFLEKKLTNMAFTCSDVMSELSRFSSRPPTEIIRQQILGTAYLRFWSIVVPIAKKCAYDTSFERDEKTLEAKIVLLAL